MQLLRLILVLFLFTLQARAGESLRILFYNAENFFDCRHDSLKDDGEFLPGGLRGWTPQRYFAKAGRLARVIASVGGNRFPALVGLAEVENDACLETLTRHSPLRNAGYAFIHEESADVRGVDVALLYDRYRFRPIGHRSWSVLFDGEPWKKTRDILHVWGRAYTGDTLHLFVVHFPSRLGGQAATEPYRRRVAQVLRSIVDSLFVFQPLVKILVMGDFNDTPVDRSLRLDLAAGRPDGGSAGSTMYNLMLPLEGFSDLGTHRNQGEWAILDQILVSGGLLSHTGPVTIHTPDFLLIDDERTMGRKPFRTYDGMRYAGGYSDHLPVWVDLTFRIPGTDSIPASGMRSIP